MPKPNTSEEDLTLRPQDAGALAVENSMLRARLAAAEKRLRATQESAGIGIAESDANGRYLWVNDAFCLITGYSREEALKLTSWQLTHPDDLNKDQPKFLRQIAGDLSTYTVEKRFFRKDGSLAWGMITGSAVRDDEGRFLYAVRTVMDITALKRGEEALRASEAQLKLAIDAAEIGIWDWNLRTNEMVWTAQAKRLFGFPENQPVTFEEARAATYPEDVERTTAIWLRARDPAIKAKEPYEYRIVRRDGAVRWVVAQGEAVFEVEDGEERAVRYVGTIQDITDRKLAEERLRDGERRLSLAIDAAQLGIWEYDFRTEAVKADAELNRLLGFPPDHTITPEEHAAGFPPGERAKVRASADAALARGERYFTAEYRFRRRSGEMRWFLLKAEFLLDLLGKPKRAIGVIMDISERKEAEERRDLLLRELNHRVKNTLATVQAIARQTLKSGESAADAYAAFEARLTALADVHSLLGRQDWHRIDFADLVDSALAPWAPGRFVKSGPSLPVSAQFGLAASMLLHELCTNAAKYGALSNPEGRVELVWSVGAPEPIFHLHWQETGGPPVVVPRRKGFGSRLIEQSFASAGVTTSRLDFAPDGVRYTLDTRLA